MEKVMVKNVKRNPDKLKGKINLHGHVHSNNIDDLLYFNVSMENINYTPISLEEIRSIFKSRGC